MSLVGSSLASGWFKGQGELSKPIPWGSRAKNMECQIKFNTQLKSGLKVKLRALDYFESVSTVK